MAIGPDKVQVLKQESAALGGDPADDVPYPSPIEPQEDALESAGIYLQDASNRDEQVYVARDGGDLIFVDVNNPLGKTLTELAVDSGLTESTHPALRQLIHLADNDGPMEGFASGAYQELLPAGSPFPTSIIWWTSSAKTAKIVENNISYNLNKTVSTDVWKSYGPDGTTVVATITDTYDYSNFLTPTRTRTF